MLTRSIFLVVVGSLTLMPQILLDGACCTANNGIGTSAEEPGFRAHACGLSWSTIRLDKFLRVQNGEGLAIAYADPGIKQQFSDNRYWRSAAVQVQISPKMLEDAAGVWQELFTDSSRQGTTLSLEHSPEHGVAGPPAHTAAVHGRTGRHAAATRFDSCASTSLQLAAVVSSSSLLPESSKQGTRRGLKRYPERQAVAPAANTGTDRCAARRAAALRLDFCASSSSKLAGEASSPPRLRHIADCEDLLAQ